MSPTGTATRPLGKGFRRDSFSWTTLRPFKHCEEHGAGFHLWTQQAQEHQRNLLSFTIQPGVQGGMRERVKYTEAATPD